VHPAVDIAQRADAHLGEGPTWDAAIQQLLWVDILRAEVHRLDPADGSDFVLHTPQHVGAAKPRAGGGLVVNLRDGVGLYDPDGSLTWLTRWPSEGCRGNDAAVDAGGRLWAGTMRYDEATGGGRLRRVDGAGETVEILRDVTVSNGIGWSPDGRLMYYVDSPTRRVDVFEVDVDTGLVSGRRPAVELAGETAGWPDGLTVDAAGCVWVALWDGGAVHRYSPMGALDRRVELPVTRPTACAFGGAGLTDLYVTTARVGLDEAQLTAEPHAGSVLVLGDAASGLPGHTFAG
jgi:sugar lactone lactonase YvrE